MKIYGPIGPHDCRRRARAMMSALQRSTGTKHLYEHLLLKNALGDFVRAVDIMDAAKKQRESGYVKEGGPEDLA